MNEVSSMNNNIINLCGGRYLYMSDFNQVINACVKDLFLKQGAGRKITVQDVDMDEDEISKKVRKLPALALEITENCNLRCKYCVYSGHYENWRNLSPRDMDFETARKGLDYIFSLIKERKKKNFTLGFYGGEPLLKFGTVKKIVAYSKDLFVGWNLRFNMTSNLTLLDDKMLDFLVKNNFMLLVSLDGAKENHDCKRVYADGRGTFDTVYGNLGKMAERYKEFFEKIGFSAVYSPDLSLKRAYEFFNGSDLVKDKRLRFSLVNPCDTTYYESIHCDWGQYQQEFDYVFSRIIDKVRQKEELTNYEEFIYNSFKKIGRNLEVREDTLLAGACQFDSRLFLDARGRFHVCERINNTFPLGDVERGFDFQKMAAMVREFADFTKTHCLDCNVRYLCNRCYVQFAGDGKFKFDPTFCDAQKMGIIDNLEKYSEYKEEGLL